MKTFFKWLGIGVLVIILGAAAWGTHEWNAEKPFSFRVFLDRTLIQQALKSPQTLTSIGVLDGMGIKGHNAHLDDASLASSQATFDELMQVKNVLVQYEDLDEDQQLSKDIALYLLNTLSGFEKYQYHSYPFNQMSGAQSNFPSFMDGQHPITDVESVDFYISRLSESKRYFTQMLEGMKLREEKNILPPRFVIQRVIDEMQGFIDKPVKENILYTSVQRRMKESDEIVEADYDGLLSNVATEIENTVYPTYQMLIDYFTGLKPKAGTDDGLWHLEGGGEAYKLALRFFYYHRLFCRLYSQCGFIRG